MRLGLALDMFTESLIGGAVSNVIFSYLNRTTLVPELGSHSSFISGAGIVLNSAGNYQSLPTNCAKFEGARYVENNCNDTEDVSVTAASPGNWVYSYGGNASTVVADDRSETNADGNTINLGKITTTGANEGIYFRVFDAPLANNKYVCSIYVYTETETTFTLRIGSGAGTSFSPAEVTGSVTVPANVLTRVALNATAIASPTGTSYYLAVTHATSGTVFWVGGMQMENKTPHATADQTIPSEYQSEGIEASPYQGCGVDGIKAIATELGNTVSSNIVTAGNGTELTGLLGQLYEPAATNLFLNSFVPVTQNITTTAQDYTVSIEGTGDITLTGTATGTATEGSPLTVTATAGTLICTKNGTVTKVNIEASSYSTSFIETVGGAVTRNQVDDEKDAPADYTDNMTVSFTFTTKDIQSANGYIVSFTDSGTGIFLIYLSGGVSSKIVKAFYGTGASSVALSGTTVLTDDTEYKVLVWLNETDGGALFVDGIEEASSITTPNIDKTQTKINLGISKAASAPVLCLLRDVAVKKQDITKAQALTQAAAL